jgi:signal transduction histidine kinase
MQNEHLHLRISDDGINQDEELDFKGMGLSSIMLRVKKMHGSVTFSKNVNGFVINLYL